jgi:mannan endo-1,4-beta-mannosidase
MPAAKHFLRNDIEGLMMAHRRIDVWLLSMALLAGAGTGFSQQGATPSPQPQTPATAPLPAGWPAPVNPHASPEARALLRFIDSTSGHATLTGQHNFPDSISRWTDRAYDLTAMYPALFGQDFGFAGGDDKDSVEARPAMIAEVERQYAHGAVIALTWHAVRPTDDEPVTFRDSVQGKLTDFEWHQLLTPGTDLNRRWCAQVDVIAGYLRQLRDAHVPVLFRAYHEMNGNWFWWGGRPGQHGSAALYRQIYDRFVNLHHLDNLVWVWNVNTPSPNAGAISDYYPGAQYVDIATMDIYGEFRPEYYTSMLALADGKPIAMAEVGTPPTPEILAAQPRWAYFMIWANLVDFDSAASLTALYRSSQVLTRDDTAIAQPMAALRQATAERTRNEPEIDPATPEAIPAAKDLLARLNVAMGRGTLSGQQNTPQAVADASAAVTRSTGEQPAIYGEEMGITTEMGVDTAEARRAIVNQAKREAARGSLVALTWHALRPTDDRPASQSSSVEGKLTDFEWNELLTPGTDLYQRWCAQVDDVASTLKELQNAKIAVLWEPYPESNSTIYWWAGRAGIHGSSALYQQLFERLVQHDNIRNLVWVWDAAAPGFGPGAGNPIDAYFPGLLDVDALALDAPAGGSRFRADTYLAQMAVGKPIGIGLTGTIPAPEFFTQQPDWAWFMASPAGATSQAPALAALYKTARVLAATRRLSQQPRGNVRFRTYLHLGAEYTQFRHAVQRLCRHPVQCYAALGTT